MKKIIKHLKENWIRHGFETLVVVVGVLIAFTLNNWNESRRNDEEARQLIRALSSDLALDTTLLHNWIDISEKELEKVKVWYDRDPDIKLLYVDYKSVIENPTVEVQKITEFINQELDEIKMVSVVDPTLYRNKN